MTLKLLFRYNQVYYVETLVSTINPIAIRPEIFETKVQWSDTSKGKVIRLGRVINFENLGEYPPDVIDVIGEDGAHYRLIKLNLDIYNTRLKDKVMLPPSFDSNEEVQNFYLSTNFEPYSY